MGFAVEEEVTEQGLQGPVTPEKTYSRRKRKPLPQQQQPRQPQFVFAFDLNELPQPDPEALPEPQRKKHRPRVAKDKQPRKKKDQAPAGTPVTSMTPITPPKRPRSRRTPTGTPATLPIATPPREPTGTPATPVRTPATPVRTPATPGTGGVPTPASQATRTRRKNAATPGTVEPALWPTVELTGKTSTKQQQNREQIVLEWLIDRLERLCIEEQTGQLVEFKGPEHQQLVAYTEKKKKLRPKVSLDVETTRVWNLLMSKGANLEDEQHPDQEAADRWARDRLVMKQRAEAFISKMHLVQGDRRFSKWKGSVVDSIVGAFLTQNVSDHLSSSAFMAVASKFPIRKTGAGFKADQENSSNIDINNDNNEMIRGSSSKVRRCLFGSGSTSESIPPATEVLSSSLVSPPVAAELEQGNCEQALKKVADEGGIVQAPTQAKKQMKGIELAKLEHSQGTAKKTYKWKDLRAKLCEGREEATDFFKSPSGPPDSVDWKSVMRANVKELADAIKERGMNNLLAGRIKAFLEGVYDEHTDIDLEWIRQVSQEEAKEFLLSIRGLGLKSVECIRLLELEHCAFPVDTNVGRICVRLGWVPIEPLPEELQLHLLELYPIQTTIQKYLWPRLCKLDQRVLYELHYQMITFGKVFCTKTKPNCNACPMKLECRHFASAYASHRLALPSATPSNAGSPPPSFQAVAALLNNDECTAPKACVPIIEEPSTPENATWDCCPDIEDCCPDIEDCCPGVSPNEVVSIDLRQVEKTQGTDSAKALVVVPPEYAYIPAPKLKVANRLRTVHYVYELPDKHPLLEPLEEREPDDPGYYLLAIWGPGDRDQSTLSDYDYTELPNSCDEELVKGTLLIPCRTAMRGSFPLNGTYFQVNEVFADHSSSWSPIDVPRSSLWNLRRRFVYFGTSVSSIFKGMTTEEIQACFWKGYVCVRGFDIETRAPRPLMTRFHVPPTPSKRT